MDPEEQKLAQLVQNIEQDFEKDEISEDSAAESDSNQNTSVSESEEGDGAEAAQRPQLEGLEEAFEVICGL